MLCYLFFTFLVISSNSLKESVFGSVIIKTLADCGGIEISEEKAAEHIKRWKSMPKNFECTPGGYTPELAAKALVNLSK